MPGGLEWRALKETRITPGKRWFSFEIESGDLCDALWWLNQPTKPPKSSAFTAQSLFTWLQAWELLRWRVVVNE